MEKFFLRFHPTEPVLAVKFSQELPDKKLSMAKLQEHLMFYRDDPKKCVENARDMIRVNDDQSEMSISEWLYRINATKMIQKFTKIDCLFVPDIKDNLDPRDPSALDPEKFKFTADDLYLKLRMNSVIAGTSEAKEDFKYLTSNQVRSIIAKFVKNKIMLEELVEMVEDQTITGF